MATRLYHTRIGRTSTKLDYIRKARQERFWMAWDANRLMSRYLPSQLTDWRIASLYKLRNEQ